MVKFGQGQGSKGKLSEWAKEEGVFFVRWLLGNQYGNLVVGIDVEFTF